jgi:hypothetical protein
MGCTSTGACAAANVIFVSSTTFPTANLGGVTGADAQCQTLAQSAALRGTFIAYLSTTTTAASLRLASARGFVRTDGRPVADTVPQLAAGNIWYPVELDERGRLVNTAPAVLTGSTSTGTLSVGSTCTDWTSADIADPGGAAAGNLHAGYAGWQSSDKLSCGGAGGYRLYCVQTTEHVAVSPAPVQGRVAFVTSSSWSPGGGLASADRRCQTDAAQAGLSGTFLALLSTSVASAASRFSLTGSPWVRPDGVAAFSQALDLGTFTTIAPIVVAADGVTHLGNVSVFNGSTATTLAGTTATTCNDWTNPDAGLSAATVSRTGLTHNADGSTVWGLTEAQCNVPSLLYCLQQ